MLTTGTVFQAIDKLKRKYIYEFSGVNLDDTTSCRYINLHNLTLNQWIDVEYAWFKERNIIIIHNGFIVKCGEREGKIIKLHTGISNNNLEVLTDNKKYTWEGTEIWNWSNTEICK